MSASPFDATGAQFAWDSTSIKLAEACQYKYYLKMIAGWQPVRKSPHLIFGGHYATALEHYHKAIAEGVPRERAIRDVVHEALIDTWEYDECQTCNGTGGDLGPEPFDQSTAAVCPDCSGLGTIPGSGHPWESTDNLKTRGNLIRTIIWYLDHFEDDSCSTIILANGAPAVEHSFKLPVDNDILLAGHLDRLVEYAHDPYVQDQKTTKSPISNYYFDQYNPDTQMSLYTFAGKAIFGIPVRGVMIDAAQIAVGFSRFVRGFTFRADDQLNEWYDDTMALIERTRANTIANHFPRNPSSCNNYGGCEFRHVCAKSPSVRNQFLRADFTQGEIWNPLRSR